MTSRHPFRTAPALGAALALALALAGCSTEPQDGASTPADDPATTTGSAADGSTTTTAAEQAGFPVTVPGVDGDVVIEERPERIVSLSPSATEILFAIGAGDQVVAADEFSTYPPEAPTTDLSGFDPNVEAIVGYEPDLVVVAMDSENLVDSLTELGIPVLLNTAPTELDGGYAGMADLGLATGQVDGAAQAISEIREGVEQALQDAPDTSLRIYHELDDTLFAASSASFIGSVYDALGAVNIADEADADGTGYPQLTEEAVVEANPELIVISDQAPYTADDVAARPGWGEVDAVRNGNIVVVDADISSRWGPRLPQLVEALADAVAEASVAAPAGR